MDFSLTEEQVLLRESVEKYVADHGGVERHRRLSRILRSAVRQCQHRVRPTEATSAPQMSQASTGTNGRFRWWAILPS